MIYHVISDVHIDHMKDPEGWMDQYAQFSFLNPCDTLIIAGDLANNNFEFLPDFCELYKNVIFVLGNHDYFGSSYYDTHEFLATHYKIPNLHILDNSSVTIDGQRFLGGTMWYSHVDKDYIDARLIRNHGRVCRQQHRKFNAYLKENLTKDDIVITHFAPSYGSCHPRYIGNPYNKYFIVNQEGLIEKRQPKAFLHGHVHDPFDYKLGRTKIHCNPGTYPNENTNPEFWQRIQIEIQ